LEYLFLCNDSFIGTKVLGTFATEERKFHRSESSKERMFHGTKVPRERKFSLWTFRSQERKCRRTKRPGFHPSSALPDHSTVYKMELWSLDPQRFYNESMTSVVYRRRRSGLAGAGLSLYACLISHFNITSIVFLSF